MLNTNFNYSQNRTDPIVQAFTSISVSDNKEHTYWGMKKQPEKFHFKPAILKVTSSIFDKKSLGEGTN